jgi:hypothetical protein
MGDGCFHPQLGYMEDFEEGKKKNKKEVPTVKVKTINSYNTDLIECSKDKNHFDFFCGKVGKEKPYKPKPVEVWIDTSSSMKRVDYRKDSTSPFCKRRDFVKKVRSICSDKADIYLFDTSRKQMGSLDGVCDNYGMNDDKRLITWIKNSQAKHLIVVTDIDELSPRLADYLDTIGATVHGVGTRALTAIELLGHKDSIKKSCN